MVSDEHSATFRSCSDKQISKLFPLNVFTQVEIQELHRCEGGHWKKKTNLHRPGTLKCLVPHSPRVGYARRGLIYVGARLASLTLGEVRCE